MVARTIRPTADPPGSRGRTSSSHPYDSSPMEASAEEFLYHKAPEKTQKSQKPEPKAAWDRDVRAAERGNKLGLVRDHLESVGAFETRCMLEETKPAPHDVQRRISSLTERMRMQK